MTLVADFTAAFRLYQREGETKCSPRDPGPQPGHKLISRRCAHRRTVEPSGKRDGSLQCGAAFSAVSPAAIRSHGLLSATEAEMPGRCQPVRQDSKRLLARSTNAATHPDACVSVVVRLPESPSVADDRVVAAQRAQPGQQMQRKPPPAHCCLCCLAVRLKRITAGVKARR